MGMDSGKAREGWQNAPESEGEGRLGKEGARRDEA